ncbi:MAG: hypothetical protein IKZ87_01690 [Actinomycetaceae bacterium]|nr:hypothetical protein [Actinomycetaceae bacterium]
MSARILHHIAQQLPCPIRLFLLPTLLIILASATMPPKDMEVPQIATVIAELRNICKNAAEAEQNALDALNKFATYLPTYQCARDEYPKMRSYYSSATHWRKECQKAQTIGAAKNCVWNAQQAANQCQKLLAAMQEQCKKRT